MRCEVLLQPRTALRGEKMLSSMVEASARAGVECIVSTGEWRGLAPLLMTYGLGHLQRRPWQEAHKRGGGRLIGWDLGYWNRDVPLAFSMRLTIDDDHPHRLVRDEPADRWEAAGIVLREDANADGPVVLVGLGKKQRALMGSRTQEWERRQAAALRRRFPDREVVYRPKRGGDELPGFRTMQGEIEQVLRGASLVVCHHSNVAVDACIAGVPVECEDGIALALYRGNPAPSREERLRFLRSVAWWQWTPLEAARAWEFIKARLT